MKVNRHTIHRLPMVLCAVLLLCATAQAVELDALLVPTLSGAGDDFWSRVPMDSGPYFPGTDKVFRGQEFTLLVFISGYKADKGKNVHLTYDLKVFDPAGKPTEDSSDGLLAYQGPMERENVLIFPAQYAKIVFTDKYPLGTYNIKVRVHDKVAGIEADKQVSVDLAPFAMGTPFTSEEDAGKWLMGYFQKPEPERILPAMNRCIQVDRGWLVENAYNLTFFVHVFKDNPFLLKEAANRFDRFATDEMKRLILMAALTDSGALDPVIRGRELKDFQKFARTIRLPDTSGKIETADQLDSLWGEFLATGRYEPVRKIVSALESSRYMGTLEKIKSGELDKNDPQVLKDAYLEASWQSALWSLTSNCVQIPQVHKYCLYMVKNEELEDGIRGQLFLILKNVQEQLKKEGR